MSLVLTSGLVAESHLAWKALLVPLWSRSWQMQPTIRARISISVRVSWKPAVCKWTHKHKCHTAVVNVKRQRLRNTHTHTHTHHSFNADNTNSINVWETAMKFCVFIFIEYATLQATNKKWPKAFKNLGWLYFELNQLIIRWNFQYQLLLIMWWAN